MTKTLYMHSASLHPGVYMGSGKQSEEPDQMQGSTLWWTNNPTQGNPSYFMPWKPGQAAWLDCSLYLDTVHVT